MVGYIIHIRFTSSLISISLKLTESLLTFSYAKALTNTGYPLPQKAPLSGHSAEKATPESHHVETHKKH
ncbi:hypothetical protein E2C01_035636 [Portunus trituberculatus]|uniref:Uncharacterized protein n=1 Tax=Portunus trituberculatus TaxID=210409 RepID=A0A5B7FBZ8_PORTR|nr:hypothetical protein [Portunus trituberculatus]